MTSKTFEDGVKESQEEFDGINIADHPFFIEGISPKLKLSLKALEGLHGWEGYNASAELWFPGILPRHANEKAIEFYNNFIRDEFDIGILSFTDGHKQGVIGRSHTKIPRPSLGCGKVFLKDLKKSIKANKDLKNLIMVPNKGEAFIHALGMVYLSVRRQRVTRLFKKY